MNFAVEEHFHLDSQALWLVAVAGVGIMYAAYRWRNWSFDKETQRRRTVPAAIAIVIGLAMLPISYFAYNSVESGKDARDRYVVTQLADSPVKFKGFPWEDTEYLDVEVMVQAGAPKPCTKGKKCQPCRATFDVILSDYEGKWPLQLGSGSSPSKGCNLDDIKDTGGLHDSDTVESRYLDDFFVLPFLGKYEKANK